MTITEFLLARIAEDKTVAATAAEPGVDYDVSSMSYDERWSPDRVEAECEAKRAIIADHECIVGGIEIRLTEPDLPDWENFTPGWYSRDVCGRCYPPEGEGRWPCATIRALAVVYDEHPDYDPEWRHARGELHA